MAQIRTLCRPEHAALLEARPSLTWLPCGLGTKPSKIHLESGHYRWSPFLSPGVRSPVVGTAQLLGILLSPLTMGSSLWIHNTSLGNSKSHFQVLYSWMVSLSPGFPPRRGARWKGSLLHLPFSVGPLSTSAPRRSFGDPWPHRCDHSAGRDVTISQAVLFSKPVGPQILKCQHPALHIACRRCGRPGSL